ncbi:MAG TPA: thiamine pyrophosphate-dependent dehydrogenase E1 component subunit alpha, partial [Clostridia bacterium]|nr:thiamine pyrophosphate-dependent dehydrogenase E1 component subunit alpha [Clostridia bacterium]
MPKSQYIDPSEARKAGWIKFKDIPVNRYQKTLAEEKDNFKKQDLLNIFFDMRLIREFEEMLMSIKTQNNYAGLDYNNPGPAHLSIGQEAAAVGQAYYLDSDDFIFGSHRSHGELLAKCFSAIRKTSDTELDAIMDGYMDGRVAQIVAPLKEKHKNSKKQAVAFVLYGVLAEIFAKETGFNKGLGGSMHSYFLPFGVFPNNAIVGGSADISVGAALYKKINRKKGVVIANIGDGSLGCGPVWEGFMLSAMDQYKMLWEGDMQGGLPILFNINNNQYAMGGQTRGETMGYDELARIGAGINPEQMHAERVNGFNPLAVIEAMGRKLELLRNKKGPVLMDTLTYRYSGHSPSDADSYRSEDEKKAWMEVDPVKVFADDLIDNKIATEKEIDLLVKEIESLIYDTVKFATDPELSPRMDLLAEPDAIEKLMFSNQKVSKFGDTKPDMLTERADNPRVKQIERRERYAFDQDGKRFSKNRTFQY